MEKPDLIIRIRSGVPEGLKILLQGHSPPPGPAAWNISGPQVKAVILFTVNHIDNTSITESQMATSASLHGRIRSLTLAYGTFAASDWSLVNAGNFGFEAMGLVSENIG